MPIAVVQVGAIVTAASSGAQAVAPTLPAGSTAGNLLVALLMTNNGGSIYSPNHLALWLEAGHVSAVDPTLYIFYYKNCAAGVTTETFSQSGIAADLAGVMIEISGAGASTPLQQIVAKQATAASITKALANVPTGCVAVSLFGDASNNTSGATPAGYTNIANQTAWGVLAAGVRMDYKLLAASAESVTYNDAGTGDLGVLLAAFQGPPPPRPIRTVLQAVRSGSY